MMYTHALDVRVAIRYRCGIHIPAHLVCIDEIFSLSVSVKVFLFPMGKVGKGRGEKRTRSILLEFVNADVRWD